MTDFPRFHQTPGCVLLPGRHYAFHRPTGTQIVDQPRQGFSTRAEGLIWLKRIADDTMNPEISLEEWESWAKVEETEMCYRCGTRKPLDELECVYDSDDEMRYYCSSRRC